MSGDFVSLNFEYYADTFYGIDVDGTSIVDVNDYASINVDYTKGSDTYSAVLLGQWNDYDEDGTCRNDDNEDGFVECKLNPLIRLKSPSSVTQQVRMVQMVTTTSSSTQTISF
jgi:hypothetical protein